METWPSLLGLLIDVRRIETPGGQSDRLDNSEAVDDRVMPDVVGLRDGTTVEEPDDDDRESENGSIELVDGMIASLTLIAVTSL